MIRLFALAFTLAAFATGPLLAQGQYSHSHMYGDFGFGMIFGPVIMLLFLAALVVGTVALVRWLMPGGSQAASDARNALDLRFAKGEIDAEEYAERKKLLG